jgi:drug/metabolite transporter (DMT)-like permease
VVCQLLRALAIILLYLFETGVGLFVDAKDIPMAVWAIIGGFGVAYVAFVYLAEMVQDKGARGLIADDGDASLEGR